MNKIAISGDVVTIDGVDFSVPSETDRAYLVMIDNLTRKLEQLRLRNG